MTVVVKWRQMNELVTVKQAAIELSVTPRTVRRYIKRSWLRGIKIGRRVRILREDIEDLKKNGVSPRMADEKEEARQDHLEGDEGCL